METYDKVAIGVAFLALGGLIVVQSRESAQLHRKWDEYDRTYGVYQEYLKSMDYACDTEGYISKIKVDTQIEYKNKGQDPEEQEYDYTLNITMNDKFAELSDEEKCLILCRYDLAAENEMARVREESGYEKCYSDLAIDDYKYDIRYRSRHIDIRRCYFVEFWSKTESYNLNYGQFEIWSKEKGKREYNYTYKTNLDKLTLFQKQKKKSSTTYSSSSSETPSSDTSSKKSSGSKKSSSSKAKKRVYNDGPRDIDDVDIEGFYEDNRDEFEDFDDAWDYLEDNPEEWDDY